jgi:hypothetical protein
LPPRPSSTHTHLAHPLPPSPTTASAVKRCCCRRRFSNTPAPFVSVCHHSPPPCATIIHRRAAPILSTPCLFATNCFPGPLSCMSTPLTHAQPCTSDGPLLSPPHIWQTPLLCVFTFAEKRVARPRGHSWPSQPKLTALCTCAPFGPPPLATPPLLGDFPPLNCS